MKEIVGYNGDLSAASGHGGRAIFIIRVYIIKKVLLNHTVIKPARKVALVMYELINK